MANWLITGVGSGLGREIAIEALRRGHTVVGTVRQMPELAAFQALGDGAHAVLADVTIEASVNNAVAAAEQITGGIDIVVNNAGRGLTGAIEETTLDEARSLFETNFFAPLAVLRAVLPGLRARRRGHVINVTSVSGLAAWHGTGIYGASKFALECLGRTLAQEVGPLGIRVTNVAPGGLRTGFAGARLANVRAGIDDYANTAHLAHEVLTGKQGSEPGDPSKAARAIVNCAGSETAPLLLLLGEDALHYAELEFAMLNAEIERSHAITVSIAADDQAAIRRNPASQTGRVSS